MPELRVHLTSPPEVVKLFTEAIEEAETGFRPTVRHLERARRISGELSTIRQNGEIFTLAGAVDYPGLLRFLFHVYSTFQNEPIAKNGQALDELGE